VHQGFCILLKSSAYDRFMEPVTIAASALLAAIDWKKIFKDLATDAARRGSKNLVERFRSDEREKAAKQAIRSIAGWSGPLAGLNPARIRRQKIV
jgi:hypothetical protein